MAGIALADAFVRITADSRPFQTDLQNLGKSPAASKAGTQIGKNISENAHKQVKTGLAAGLGAAVGIFGGRLFGTIAANAGSIFKGFIADARESAQIGRQTAAVIASTGGAARISATAVGNLATAISNKTGADDEAIQSGENLLLTFTNIRNGVGKSNDIFNQASQATTDMAAALNHGQVTADGMKSSSILLGKALNDPLKGLSALTRVGVSFTDEQKKQIAALVKSGDTMGAQKVILRELGREFGGAAKAGADPMQRLTVIVQNLGEQIGGYLLPYIDQFATWLGTKAVPAIARFAQQMHDGTGFAGQLAGAFKTTVAIGQGVLGFFSRHATLAKIVLGTVVALTAAVKINAAAMKLQASIALAGSLTEYLKKINLVQVATKLWTAVTWLLDAALNANPIGLVTIAVAALVAGIIIAYKRSDTFRQIVQAAFRGISDAARFMWNSVLRPIFAAIVRTFLDMAGSIVNGAAKAFGWVPGLGGKLKTAAAAFNTFKDRINASLKGVTANRSVTVSVGFTDPTVRLGKNIARARGGAIFGPGSETSDSIPAMLSTGEHVWTAKEVRAAGGHAAVESLRKAVLAQKFATGGAVGVTVTPEMIGLAHMTRLLGTALDNVALKIGKSVFSSFSAVGAGSGSGVTRWAGVILQALRLVGQPAGLLGSTERRMQRESGGNPTIVNRWDSNWLRGTPSVGLMQVIGPTFRAYAGPFRNTGPFEYGVSVNPLANIYASMRYALSRYGSLSRAYDRAGGYDKGGWLPPGLSVAFNGTGKPERVLGPGNANPSPVALRPEDINSLASAIAGIVVAAVGAGNYAMGRKSDLYLRGG